MQCAHIFTSSCCRAVVTFFFFFSRCNFHTIYTNTNIYILLKSNKKYIHTHTHMHQSSAMYWIQVVENLMKTKQNKKKENKFYDALCKRWTFKFENKSFSWCIFKNFYVSVFNKVYIGMGVVKRHTHFDAAVNSI